MVKHLTEDKDFQEELEQEVADKALAKTLFAMRCSGGITQAEMASRIGCTQSRLSKLENSGTAGIKVGDLIAYAKALGLNLSISFQREMTSVESVKLHAFEIKKHLDHLAELAHRDDAIFDGVKNFYSEYLVNILHLFSESADKLPKKPKESRPVLEIHPPTEGVGEEVALLSGEEG